MPVVALEMGRFSSLVGADRNTILARLPYVGLDIESVEKGTVRVEYSPNRPDFGTDYGIAKALRGLMGIEVGLRRYAVSSSGITVSVDPRLASVRPYIACATVEGLRLDDEDIRQVISLQEDLHNGLGRKRKRVAVGLHNLDALSPPIQYKAASHSFQFAPLDSVKEMTLEDILTETKTGKLYAHTLKHAKLYPILSDSKGTAFSFPPIINSSATRVTRATKNLFIDVTSSERKSGDDVLAVIVTTLADMGGRIGSVVVDYQGKTRTTPDLQVSEVPLDEELVRKVTGLELETRSVVDCIRKCRLDVKKGVVLVPRYRLDILHPVDIAEEVALGYGIDRIIPVYPPSKEPGAFNAFEQLLERIANTMAGSGMIELMTYELIDERTLYTNFERSSALKVSVEGPKSIEHSLLRDSLIPSLMSALSKNMKEEYPQRVFEIGRVYVRTAKGVNEVWKLACLSAHAQSSFSEAKMFLESFCRTMFGSKLVTRPTSHWAFASGRSASANLKGANLGAVGEIRPDVLASFGIGVPVCGFEVDLSLLAKQLKYDA